MLTVKLELLIKKAVEKMIKENENLEFGKYNYLVQLDNGTVEVKELEE